MGAKGPRREAGSGWRAEREKSSSPARRLPPRPRMVKRMYRFSRLPRNMMLNRAAKRSSEPRIIWYTLTVVHTRPVFMRTVATRSKKLGNARASSCFPVTPAGAELQAG